MAALSRVLLTHSILASLVLAIFAPLLFRPIPAVALDTAPDADIETIFVSASRLDTPLEETPTSSSVVTSRDLRASRARSTLRALSETPGLDLVQSGSGGSAGSVFLRGHPSEHTLVFIDGVRVNDPASTSGGYGFSTIPIESIDRIEIVRGAESAIYGSDAMGGVIQIFTKTGTAHPETEIVAEAGTLGRTKINGETTGKSGDWGYALGTGFERETGFSAAETRDGNTEADAWDAVSVRGKLGLKSSQTSQWEALALYRKQNTDLDGHGGAGGDDPNYTGTTEELTSGLSYSTSFNRQTLAPKATLSYHRSTRETRNSADSQHVGESSYDFFQGERFSGELKSIIRFTPSQSSVIGVSGTQDTAETLSRSETPTVPAFSSAVPLITLASASAYGEHQIKSDDWLASLGARWDWHESIGGQPTGRVGGSVQLTSGSRLKSNIGTGFKAPTLYQIYSEYGSKTLLPEHGISWDLSLENDLSALDGTVEITYFQSVIRDLIDFDTTTSKYANIGSADIYGAELSGRMRVLNSLTLGGSGTWTETHDSSTGQELLRRPRLKSSLFAETPLPPNWTLRGEGSWTGPRSDKDFSTGNRLTLDPALLINLNIGYRLSKKSELYARGENLLDTHYQKAAGYGTAGVTAAVGARVGL